MEESALNLALSLLPLFRVHSYYWPILVKALPKPYSPEKITAVLNFSNFSNFKFKFEFKKDQSKFGAGVRNLLMKQN